MSVRGFNTGAGIEQYDYDYLDNKPDAPTKESIGLGNVDNTSDMDKPVSTLQAQALSQKVDKVPGMGLSQEDYTSADKEKLGDLPTNEELEADLEGKANQTEVASLDQAINVLDGVVNDSTTGLDTKAPAIVNTVSGAIASFPDGADSMPVKQLMVSIEPAQAGTGDPSPENIRPISGWTGAEIEGCGKNLLKTHDDNSWNPSLTKNTDGSITVVGMRTSNGANVIGTVDLKANTNYVLSASGNSDLYYQMIVNGSQVGSALLTDFTYTPTEDATAIIRIFARGNINFNYVLYPQLELGTTATEYEPFQSKEISVTFPSSAGTVYGGTLTINTDRTGTLVVDRAKLALTSSMNIDTFNNATSGNGINITGALPTAMNMASGICTHTVVGEYLSTINNMVLGSNNRYIYWTSILDVLGISTVAEFKTWLDTQTVEVVFNLATPVTYTLTPTEIDGILATLYGTNNIWADCGDTSVTYAADTKLYIEHLTQPTEDDMTADHAISSGTFFMIGNNLYLATSQIAAGATITPGTNATKLSLADALNQLNT